MAVGGGRGGIRERANAWQVVGEKGRPVGSGALLQTGLLAGWIRIIRGSLGQHHEAGCRDSEWRLNASPKGALAQHGKQHAAVKGPASRRPVTFGPCLAQGAEAELS
ncbi:hypothetical protein CKAH01_11947 [Colletotrichum kahawae]|uniref:Uncharacterized protein n=1 Tax=Colletotrichum kahawae TaxID=34407 RepID=A0AAD9YTD8_COLKA|nr:hypothetical protein CKAH01_11947 [Colletotrichum kahawae]